MGVIGKPIWLAQLKRIKLSKYGHWEMEKRKPQYSLNTKSIEGEIKGKDKPCEPRGLTT